LPEELTPAERARPRHEIPGQCVKAYDDYVRAQVRVKELEPRLRQAAQRFKQAVEHLTNQMTKFTLATGLDAGELISGVTVGVHGAGDVLRPRGLGPRDTWRPRATSSIGRAMEALAARISQLRSRLLQIADELAELGSRMTRARQLIAAAVDNARALRAKANELAAAVLDSEGQWRRALSDYDERLARATQQVSDARGRLRTAAFNVERMENMVPNAHTASGLRRQWREAEQAVESAGAAIDAAREAQKRTTEQIAQQIKDSQRRIATLYEARMDFPIDSDDYKRLSQQINDLEAADRQLDRVVEESRQALEAQVASQRIARKRMQQIEDQLMHWDHIPDPDDLQKGITEARGAAEAAQRELDAALEAERLVHADSRAVSAAEEQLRSRRAAAEAAEQAAKEAELHARTASGGVEEIEALERQKWAEEGQLRRELADAEGEMSRLGADHESLPPTPDTATAWITQKLGRAAAKVEEVFGGTQSGEEIGRILAQCRAEVDERRGIMEALEQEYANAIADVHARKALLDQCLAAARLGG
jgi:chromosome segregation ATPase